MRKKTYLEKIECRGRNGWFELRQIYVSIGYPDGEALIDLYSKTYGKTPPIIFSGNIQDLKKLFKDIAREIKPGGGGWLEVSIKEHR